MRPIPSAWILSVVLPAVLLGAGATPGAGAADATPLPDDPALVRGALANGLRYVLLRHGNPEGRIGIWLHVASGSLNETEEQRGIAHYLEHMAFNGSQHFPPGSLVPFFESLGMSFGRDQNAFTGFDQTTYMLALPDGREATIAKGLLYLSDVGLRLSLLPAEIESERQIILEEKRTRAGAGQRVQDYVFERLAPGSVFGRRLPIGTEETIRAVQEQDFRAYYSTWYVPSNLTVIAVGDCDMGPVAKAIEQAFADGPKAPRPTPRDAGVRPSDTTRAIVATDPERTAAEVSILRVDRPRPPRATVEDLRRDLVETIGTWIFNRRMESALAAGTVAFLGARASIDETANAIRTVQVQASSRPERWREALADIARALQQARTFGFSPREVADARRDLLADAERDVQRAGTQPARAHLFRLLRAVTRGEPSPSAEQRLELKRALLAAVTAEEVSAAFKAGFDPTHVTFVATLPAGDGVPTEAQLIEVGQAALALEPPRPAEAARVTALMATKPSPGTVAEEHVHEASSVWSAWLENGIRVHHKQVTQRRHDVSISITLAGGAIEETAESRGRTEAAALAWSRPATSALSSTQIRDLMTGLNVRVEGGAEPDALTLSVSGDPQDLEAGLQLAHLLLTDPVIEPAALAQWQEGQVQEIQGRKAQPGGVLGEALARALFPAVAGMQPLEVADVERITLALAQAWLRRLVKEAPIEVAVVGDLDRARARELVATYLGSLPARERIVPDPFVARRRVTRPQGPIAVERTVDTQTPQAFVLDGFFGANVQDVADVRRLQLASRILSTRMIATIREQKRLVYGIGAGSRPAEAYPGLGLFLAQAPTDPARVTALGAAIEETYVAFRTDGPTQEEMTVAQRQMANLLDETMPTPRFWAERLETLDYRGLSLDDVVALPSAYQALTREEVRVTFARYCVPEARFRFVVQPRIATPPEPEAAPAR